MVRRTDTHRPGVIMPWDYTYVFTYSEDYNYDKALQIRKFVTFSPATPDGIFKCTICGATYKHGDIWKHMPSGEYITVGHDCADKYSLFAGRTMWKRWLRERKLENRSTRG